MLYPQPPHPPQKPNLHPILSLTVNKLSILLHRRKSGSRVNKLILNRYHHQICFNFAHTFKRRQNRVHLAFSTWKLKTAFQAIHITTWVIKRYSEFCSVAKVQYTASSPQLYDKVQESTSLYISKSVHSLLQT